MPKTTTKWRLNRCINCQRKYTRAMIITIENVLQPGRKHVLDEHYCVKCYNKDHYDRKVRKR